VAAVQLVSEITNQCQNSAAESGSTSREDSPTKEKAWSETSLSCQTIVTNDDATNAVGPWNKIGNQSSGFIDTRTICEFLSMLELDNYFVSFDQKEAHNTTGNDDKVESSTMTEEERRTKRLLTDTLEKLTDDQLLEICEMKMSPITENDRTNDLGSFKVLEEQKDLLDKLSDFASKTEFNHSDHNFWQKLCKIYNQQGSFKKPRQKKRNRRLFSESDKDPHQDTKILADMVSLCSSESKCDTANEDEDCFPNDNRTSRAITDVPDVVVIGGGSIVPKDLCSTRTLTSRTQTAPSRATYTTAYI